MDGSLAELQRPVRGSWIGFQNLKLGKQDKGQKGTCACWIQKYADGDNTRLAAAVVFRGMSIKPRHCLNRWVRWPRSLDVRS
jgi:hypothetical protein